MPPVTPQEHCSLFGLSLAKRSLMRHHGGVSDSSAPTDPRAGVHRTARALAREQITGDLLTAARAQLATVGAEALSLRAVAREVGMASSAVYRYFPSRDALLTALIIEAYDAVGDVAERAAAETASAGPAEQFRAVWRAVRSSSTTCRF